MKHLLAHNHCSKKGFTLIEIILAVVVIGILIAIIVPRAQRANVSAKYAGVRQAAAEIGRWGMDWATRNLESQDPNATCTLDGYLATLVGYVGNSNASNWINVNEDLTGAGECRETTSGINYSVADILPPESQPRNPFNGVSYFSSNPNNPNSGTQATAGLLYLGVVLNNGANYYYFVYSGTDANAVDDWHAGMGDDTNFTYAELRNGIFMARQVP